MKENNTREQHEELTQRYASWGDKLLQHADVLHSIQHDKKFKPITVQLAPCEACDSDCPFCSVAERPIKRYMPWSDLVKCLTGFKQLGAKSLEITGGGNPLLYKDKVEKKDINDIVRLGIDLGFDVGIITNSEKLTRLDASLFDRISWIRISLIKLDEGSTPESYDFCGFPYSKLGFSYIIYDECGSSPIRGKYYEGTSEATIEKIARLVELHNGNIKFVRFAGNCLVKGNNSLIRRTFGAIVEGNDRYKKFFIKTIDDNDDAYDNGCYVGMIRPYVAPSPKKDDQRYMVYTCTSHVLNTRTYDLDYALCEATCVVEAWDKMNQRYATLGRPYDVKNSIACGWKDTCKFCYYNNNNRLLHTVATEMPDKNFP